jgi:hypothetical protein
LPTLTSPDVTVAVFTFKDGIAARLGHDLKILAHAVSCTLEKGGTEPLRIEALIDPRQVKVNCAQASGRDDHGALSASDKNKINGHIQNDVLRTRTHGEIRFVSTKVTAMANGFDISGNLTLTGQTRPIRLLVERQGEKYVARVRLNQLDFGIKPFSAPLGVLRIKPVVVVEVALPGDLASRT